MWEELESRFSDILKPLFPAGSDFRRRRSSDLRFAVSWKLNDDPARPNKSSRCIILVIPEDAVEDYSDATANERASQENRIIHSVTERLKVFDPHHSSAYNQPAPEEEWILP